MVGVDGGSVQGQNGEAMLQPTEDSMLLHSPCPSI